MELSKEFGKDEIQESVASRLLGAWTGDEGSNSEVSDLGTNVEMTSYDPKFKTFVMAGAAAGIMEHCAMYPVDCVKVIFLSDICLLIPFFYSLHPVHNIDHL